MGFFLDMLDFLSEQNKRAEKREREDLERRMDVYGLEEWQKELVRKGEYGPENFDEDGELTEDDYYYEDE